MQSPCAPPCGVRTIHPSVENARAGAAHASDHAGSLSALEISVSVAFSVSLTATPPMPRNPPSVAASATCWLI